MKLRNKLILSCAALAAVATTAVSTTFAWYTQNTEVTAKGVTGQTLTSDQSVLMISKDNYNWGSKVDLNLESLSLVPVFHRAANGYYKATDVTSDNFAAKKSTLFETADGEEFEATDDATFSAESTYYYAQTAGFYGWNQTDNVANVSATPNVDYLTFDLYFKSGTTDSLNVFIKKFNLVNTTAQDSALDPKIKLNNTGLPVASTTYTVDMFRALTIDQNVFTTVEKLSENDEDYLDTMEAVDASTKVWDCQSLAGTDSLTGVSGYNAHKYYNAVKGLYEDVYTAANNPVYDEDEEEWSGTLASFAANTTYYVFNSTTHEYDALTSQQVTAGPVEGTQYFTMTRTVTGIDETITNSELTRTDLADTSDGSYDHTSWKLGVTGAGSTDSDVASNVLKVTFVIYLDGWDLACFDACQGQNFTLDMEFVSSKA